MKTRVIDQFVVTGYKQDTVLKLESVTIWNGLEKT